MMLRPTGYKGEIRFGVVRRLHLSPDLCRRGLTRVLGISLGSVNNCIQALMESGFVRTQHPGEGRFSRRCAYLLTAAGVVQRSRLTAEFFKRRITGYEVLRNEIEAPKAGLPNHTGRPQSGEQLVSAYSL